MKSLEQFIAEAKEKSIAEAKAIEEAKDTVFAVVDENDVILNVFNTEEEADEEIEALKKEENPVPVKKQKMKRSEIESKEE